MEAGGRGTYTSMGPLGFVQSSERVRHLRLAASTTMSASDEKMREFKALSYRDKWRVNRALARGEAPADPRLAAPAVELAERHLQGREHPKLMRGLTMVLVVAFGALAIVAAIQGESVDTVLYGLLSVAQLGQMKLNPIARPKHMARALEQSRRVAVAMPSSR
jgi:hypothetical protein